MHVFKYLNEHTISQFLFKKTTINFHKRVMENLQLQKTIINKEKKTSAQMKSRNKVSDTK